MRRFALITNSIVFLMLAIAPFAQLNYFPGRESFYFDHHPLMDKFFNTLFGIPYCILHSLLVVFLVLFLWSLLKRKKKGVSIALFCAGMVLSVAVTVSTFNFSFFDRSGLGTGMGCILMVPVDVAQSITTQEAWVTQDQTLYEQCLEHTSHVPSAETALAQYLIYGAFFLLVIQILLYPFIYMIRYLRRSV